MEIHAGDPVSELLVCLPPIPKSNLVQIESSFPAEEKTLWRWPRHHTAATVIVSSSPGPHRTRKAARQFFSSIKMPAMAVDVVFTIEVESAFLTKAGIATIAETMIKAVHKCCSSNMVKGGIDTSSIWLLFLPTKRGHSSIKYA